VNLAIEKFASPENSDPEKYTGLVNSLLIILRKTEVRKLKTYAE
jgi:hypothetical protein